MPPPAIETPSLLCSIKVRRERERVGCGRVARRYAVSKHGHTFADQFRCAKHAHLLRREGYSVTWLGRRKKETK